MWTKYICYTFSIGNLLFALMKLSKSSSIQTSEFVSAILVFFFLAMLVLIPSANANWLVNWQAGAFVEYTDNVLRSDTDEESDYVLEPRASITATHLGPRFDASIGADTEYRGYSEGTIGDRNDANLDAQLEWKISPNLFVWTFEDHFSSEFPIDIRDAPNQRNQQNVNTFVTGPTFTPRIFKHTFLNLQGRYANTQTERSNIDNDRLQGTVGIVRELTPNSTISLNYLHEDVKFHEKTTRPSTDGNVDFARNDYYLGYGITRPSLGIEATLGYTKINRDTGPNKSSEGNNSSISIDYTINSTSSLGFNAYDSFTDTSSNSVGGSEFGLGGGFGGVGGIPGIGGGDNEFGDIDLITTGDTSDVQGFSLSYNKRFTKLGTEFQIFNREEDYDLVDFNDREVNGATVTFTLPYSSLLLFGLSGEYRESDFDIGDRDDNDKYIELSSTYFYTRNWRFESSVDYRERDSDQQGSDFDAYEFRVGIVYSNF